MSNKLDGITWHAEGEANFYRLMRGGNWLARVQFNGELLVWDMEDILRAMLQEKQAATVGDPVAVVTGTYGGFFTIEALNRSLVLPPGMALYANPRMDALQACALEAKAAPVGEREAAIEAAYAAVVDGGWSSVKEMGVSMFQAGAAWQRAQSALAGAVNDGLPLVIAGAIFDFAGFLTTRERVIEVGATANASPVAELVQEWAELRGLSLADAAVLSWQYLLVAPAQPAAQGESGAASPSAPATVQVDGWIPVSERLPESERTVLAFYLNSHDKGRRVRAEYIAAKTKSADDGWDSEEPADYDEQADEYFWPAGWYEVMDNWDDLTHMVIHEGEVTHWMPLPESPAIAAARKEGGKV